jgi:hypothetical protein
LDACDSVKRWCCSFFEDEVNKRGKRGSSIHFVQASDVLGFLLTWQVTDDADRSKLDLNTPFPVTLGQEQGILFCPWCGMELRGFYSPQVRER